MPRYFKEEHDRPLGRNSLAAEWGECTCYVEIGDDGYASRQIEDYGKHGVLRYDRTHWGDRFSHIVLCLFSRKPKAITGRRNCEAIEAKEFERAWRAALQSPLWEKQVEEALVHWHLPWTVTSQD